MIPGLQVARDVATALSAGHAVVALETTLVTHGFPRSEGLELARVLEAEVRERGAVPATIGVLGGALRVGLTANELERLAAGHAEKLGPSNLAARIASGRPGSTTVGATLIAAHAAGIRVFATGGIGGVHRGSAFDVSADLLALSRHPVAVVCSGAKAVLDLPRTREALEALGVPVLGFGTDEVPAFYSRRSGLPVDARFDSLQELSRAVTTHLALGTGAGVLICNPVPAEEELDAAACETALAESLALAESRGVTGRDVTPFLLEELRRRTGGRSLRANKALLVSNARLAASLASGLCSASHGRGDAIDDAMNRP
ncbi:MAG TPA: pseudouridine-5'-phosphate glycosidase [Vicinamibacteria bacterium]|nr:pseudouridine-5'-phosphate glycosidase [Vicinamibacteria bacterium]